MTVRLLDQAQSVGNSLRVSAMPDAGSLGAVVGPTHFCHKLVRHASPVQLPSTTATHPALPSWLRHPLDVAVSYRIGTESLLSECKPVS